MHKAERFGRAVLWNLALAILTFGALVGLLHAFTPEGFSALSASKQMGVVVAAGALAAGTVIRAGGCLSALAMKVSRNVSG